MKKKKKMYKTILKVLLFYILLTACAPGSITESQEIRIHDLQGCGHISLFNGQHVKGIQGIVTFKDANGYYLQSTEPDDLWCTSEGIYVFTGVYPNVYPGDFVTVDGKVSEFTPGNLEDQNLSITELINPRSVVISSGNKLPEPLYLEDQNKWIPLLSIEDDAFERFEPENDGIDFYESLESMVVGVRHGTVVDAINAYDEIIVLPTIFLSSNLISSSGALLTSVYDNNPEKVMFKLLGSTKGEILIGDLIEHPLIGVMTYSFGNYKLLTYQNVEPFPLKYTPSPFITTREGLTVATYNVENLSLEDPEGKFETLASQIVDSLGAPDILVMHEVMDDSGQLDDGTVAAIKTLNKLADWIEEVGGPRYAFVDNPPQNDQDGGIPGGNIRSVLLFRLDRDLKLAEPDSGIQGFEVNDGEIKFSRNPLRIGEFSEAFYGSRKPAAWLLTQNGYPVVVLSMHLVSQGKNDPLWGRNQPILRPEENQRILQTQFIAEFSKKIQSDTLNVPILLVGDLNDSPWSEAAQVFEKVGFTNLGMLDEEPERFSYVFEGDAQQIDYILINNQNLGQVIQSKFIHLNTHLSSWDQVSDHDALVIEVQLR